MSFATSRTPSDSEHPSTAATACFAVRAAADPGTLPRLLEPFAKRGLAPDAVRAVREGEDVAVEIECRDMTAELAEYIARCLREIFVVETVLTSRR